MNEFCTMFCGSCPFNDGLVYTAMPPKYKCKFDNNFYDGSHICHLELAPVIHAKWEDGDGYIDCVDGNWDYAYEVPTYRCSVCKSESELASDYCPDCGAKMDGE